MITLRHHILTLVAVFLALAVGIVLGGGPLSEVGRSAEDAGSSAAPAETDEPSAFSDDFVAAVGPRVTSGTLTDRGVAVLTLPGADEQAVTALGEGISSAGGSVTARVDLSESAVDPGQKSLVDTLGSQLMTQQPDGTVSAEATTYDRLGELLGWALATDSPEGAPFNSRTSAVTDAIGGAELIGPIDGVERRAPLVLVVLGEDGGDDQTDAILSGVLQGLSRHAAGVVTVGTVADGGEGQLARLRANPVASEVTTVDGIDLAAGRVAAVLALKQALDAPGGAFGASGADGPAPLG